MAPTKARKGRNQAAKEQKVQGFLNLCAILAEDKEFLTLVSECTNPATLNAYVFAKAQVTNYKKNVAPANAFTKVKTLLGTYLCHELPSSIQSLHQSLKAHTSKSTQLRLRSHYRKNKIAKRIGFRPSPTTIINSVPPIKLSKLSTPYPIPNAYVLERSKPIPSPPKVTDTSCGKCDLLIPIDESKLQYTVSATESAVIQDDVSGNIIAVVIRDFAQDYYSIIKPWAVDLINDSIDRRTLSQRNGPGKLARVGVTDGARNARVFGWSRSLKQKFRKGRRSDHDDHERNISALFGLFYSLFQAQAPPEIIKDLETAMTTADLPRLDFDKRMKFPLPFFTEKPMTFYGYPLSPPEGYIARNFAKQIHADKHWTNCPWGAYWNLKRSTPTQESGMEYGANFFISDYGLRIVNSENVCVIWNISMLHGTSWYYENLEHVGIAFVLSPTTEEAWKEYQDRVNKGEIEDGFTIIDDMVEH